jgi:hypothetical protein
MEPTSTVIRLDDYRRRPPDPIPTVEEEPGPASTQTLTWKISQRGNPYVVVNEAYHVVVFRRGSWAFRIEDLETGQAWFSDRRYETEDAARADALLAVGQLRGRGLEPAITPPGW